MKNRQASLTLLCLLAAPASEAVAQTGSNERRDPASALAAGFSVRSGSDAQLMKGPGRQLTVPTGWTRMRFPTGPDYTSSKLFGSLAPYVIVDAMSTGSDIIPTPDGNGVPNLISNGRWMGLVASVRNDSAGLQNSLIEEARQGGRSNGSDLFSHYFQESSGIDSNLAGGTFVSQTQELMAISGSALEDIDALDFGLGVRSFGGLPAGSDPLFVEHDSFYFSVTPQSALILNAVTGSQFATDQFSNPVPAHAADVYHLDWTGSQWTGPYLYRDWQTLGLLTVDDIDALAVDPIRGTTIFSTQVVDQRSQLLINEFVWGTQPLATRESGTTVVSKVTEKVGGVDDTTDIDAVCILDPTEFTYSAYFGTPTAWLSGTALHSPMGLSVTRTGRIGPDSDAFVGTPVGVDTLHIQLSGRRGNPLSKSLVTFYMSKNFDPAAGWQQATWKAISEPMWRYDEGTEKTITFEYQIPVPDAPAGSKIAIVSIVMDKQKKVIGGSWISELYMP